MRRVNTPASIFPQWSIIAGFDCAITLWRAKQQNPVCSDLMVISGGHFTTTPRQTGNGRHMFNIGEKLLIKNGSCQTRLQLWRVPYQGNDVLPFRLMRRCMKRCVISNTVQALGLSICTVTVLLLITINQSPLRSIHFRFAHFSPKHLMW